MPQTGLLTFLKKYDEPLVCEQDQASREKIISALTSMEYQITTPVMLKKVLNHAVPCL